MQRPDIIAHRGSSRECPENTLAAFTRALAQQADGIELDVHGLADGQLVVHHDAVIRLDEETGRGGTAVLREMTLPQLRAVRLPGGHPVPVLDDVFDLVGPLATVYVEVKAPGIERAIAALLDRHPTVRAAVHAFDHRIPWAVRALRPGTAIGFLSASYPLEPVRILEPMVPDALWQHAPLIDQALVDAVHQRGARVIAWTENDPVRARELASWGVDGLCTDVPATIRAAFDVP